METKFDVFIVVGTSKHYVCFVFSCLVILKLLFLWIFLHFPDERKMKHGKHVQTKLRRTNL
jgi:hypothetical protein